MIRYPICSGRFRPEHISDRNISGTSSCVFRSLLFFRISYRFSSLFSFGFFRIPEQRLTGPAKAAEIVLRFLSGSRRIF